MKLIELLQSTTSYYHPLFKELSNLTPKEAPLPSSNYISVYPTTEPDYDEPTSQWYLDGTHFKVTVLNPENGQPTRDIQYIDWSELLSYDINPISLKRLQKKDILDIILNTLQPLGLTYLVAKENQHQFQQFVQETLQNHTDATLIDTLLNEYQIQQGWIPKLKPGKPGNANYNRVLEKSQRINKIFVEQYNQPILEKDVE